MQTFKMPLNKETEIAYIKAAKAGDLHSRNELVEYNLRLVAHIVKKYNIPEQDFEDYISIGTIGLIKAINTYNPDKGSKLVTYASRCIENEILMALRQVKKSTKDVSLFEPIGTDKEGNEIRLVDVIDGKNNHMLEDMIRDDDYSCIKKHMTDVLSPMELRVIYMRYDKELTQRQVAIDLGISRSYVSRIEKRALKKLRALI